MNVLIVEDEPHAVARLKDVLIVVAPECRVIGVTASVLETVTWLNAHPMPDLIIMDVHLADGNCFSIFDVCDITAPIVFCTAYDEYALKAFRTNGIAYLLKPINEEDVRGAFEKLDTLRQPIESSILSTRRQALRLLDGNQEGYKTRFLIKAGDKLLPAHTKDIACFISESHGPKVYFFNAESYYIDYTLAELINVLNPRDFQQISRQAIISLNAIRAASTGLRSAQVTIKVMDRSLPIARSRVKAFRKWIGQ